ncbi:oxidative damage protection protein [uncultured Microbacterium sp.]|uniref:oxidative damage protection protein n=1 Tax=uncultured Microbacterium sp. TaxID=191216 RepID=UPI0025CF8672|nr:oxidative damage protection protein [uncultured Microbacterium sp.]
MTRTVHCAKLDAELPALDRPPLPGEIGQRIYDQISRDAWSQWLSHQTMLINEYRLPLADPKARDFLMQEMEKFFFGEGSAVPQGYVPEDQK